MGKAKGETGAEKGPGVKSGLEVRLVCAAPCCSPPGPSKQDSSARAQVPYTLLQQRNQTQHPFTAHPRAH